MSPNLYKKVIVSNLSQIAIKHPQSNIVKYICNFEYKHFLKTQKEFK